MASAAQNPSAIGGRWHRPPKTHRLSAADGIGRPKTHRHRRPMASAASNPIHRPPIADGIGLSIGFFYRPGP